MLARERLRNDPEAIAHGLGERGVEPEVFVRWSELDAQRRNTLVAVEELKRQRNETSRRIGELKARGESADDVIAAVGGLKGEIEALESKRSDLEEELSSIELRLPNLAHESVPRDENETANRVERIVGEPTSFDFEPQAHWDLGPALGILDFERGAKLSGARFTVYFGAGARLERALANFMIDLHTERHGYTEVIPPLLVSAESMTATGQLPKFAADAFQLKDDGHFLIPTSEVPLANLHRGEILDEDRLPLRYTAWTPCFRSEAGSYGKDVRGLIRQHQFSKVELVQYAVPDRSYEALEELTGQAELVLQQLELPYRAVCLSTGDMGFAAAKTYDLEVWLPGEQAYREISSCSNCEDFQARRGNLRYRPSDGGKPRLLHTLNGSALAVGRTLVAVLENYQRADGNVAVPEVLQPYLGGLEVIEPRG